MKTVFKKIGAWIAIGLFALCICTMPKKAKASEDNTPTQSPDYNFTLINCPTDFYFTSLTGSTRYYYPTYLRFQIYNVDNPDLGGATTMDRVTYLYKNSQSNTAYLTSATGEIACAFIYQDTSTNPINSNRFDYLNLNYTRETSEEISGVMKSYQMDTSALDSSLHINKGFSIKFNFEVGYKKYTFETSSLSCIFYSANTNPLPRTYPLSINSGQDIEIYNTAKKEGYTEGYNAGYNTGEEAGKKSGYTTGYNNGYNDGRTAPDYSFKEFFEGFGNAFVTIYWNMLNYDFLGINLAGLIGTIVVIATVAIVVGFLKK